VEIENIVSIPAFGHLLSADRAADDSGSRRRKCAPNHPNRGSRSARHLSGGLPLFDCLIPAENLGPLGRGQMAKRQVVWDATRSRGCQCDCFICPAGVSLMRICRLYHRLSRRVPRLGLLDSLSAVLSRDFSLSDDIQSFLSRRWAARTHASASMPVKT
jgi:hypothetical protein